MKKKICTKCKEEKSLDEFYAQKNHSDGKQSCCKLCQKNHYIKNKDKIKRYKINYRLKNKEKLQADRKKYYLENKSKINANCNDYYTKNKEQITVYKKKWQENNKEKRSIQQKEYYLEHKEEIDKYCNKYKIQRRKIDVNYRMRDSLRVRIRLALKGQNKSTSTMKLLGCTIKFLKTHLQSQFTKDMSWANYGRKKAVKCWHIDHIRPCASFDLSKLSQQRKCFNYKNLQPLWAKDNIAKGAKWNNTSTT